MSTNYYVAKNSCVCCDRYDEAYHIGKSSSGWSFSFQGYHKEQLVSWQAWKQFLREREIRDEYGSVIDYQEFVHMVETVKAPGYVREDGHRNRQQNEEGRKPTESGFTWFNHEYDWDDPQGYAFSSREFC